MGAMFKRQVILSLSYCTTTSPALAVAHPPPTPVHNELSDLGPTTDAPVFVKIWYTEFTAAKMWSRRSPYSLVHLRGSGLHQT
jgi:hypothetical protein